MPLSTYVAQTLIFKSNRTLENLCDIFRLRHFAAGEAAFSFVEK